jgi:hypothetical protein
LIYISLIAALWIGLSPPSRADEVYKVDFQNGASIRYYFYSGIAGSDVYYYGPGDRHGIPVRNRVELTMIDDGGFITRDLFTSLNVSRNVLPYNAKVPFAIFGEKDRPHTVIDQDGGVGTFNLDEFGRNFQTKTVLIEGQKTLLVSVHAKRGAGSLSRLTKAFSGLYLFSDTQSPQQISEDAVDFNKPGDVEIKDKDIYVKGKHAAAFDRKPIAYEINVRPSIAKPMTEQCVAEEVAQLLKSISHKK